MESNRLLDSREQEVAYFRSHYVFYIVGEKDGEEIYVVVPSTSKKEKPYVTTWCYDYSFKQVVEEFNKLGANYVTDVPDDYYSAIGSFLNIETDDNFITHDAEYYEVVEPETFYERLDVKAVFTYRRAEEDAIHDYMVAQVGGELVSYEKVTEL